jgi:hypothetical protein
MNKQQLTGVATRVTASVVAVSLVAAGCGSTTLASWVGKENALCRTYTPKISASVGAPGTTQAQRFAQLKQKVAVTDEFVAKIKAVSLPSSSADKASAQAWVTAMSDTDTALHGIADATKLTNPSARIATIRPLMDAGQRAVASASKLGLTDCSAGGPGPAGGPPAGGPPPAAGAPPAVPSGTAPPGASSPPAGSAPPTTGAPTSN